MTSPQHPLGTYGVWRGRRVLTPALATEIEKLGYGTLWVGGSPGPELDEVEAALEATERIVVATGIVNIWRGDAEAVARSFRRIDDRHPGRLLLGIGTGHRESDAPRRSPLAAMSEYLDVLDAEGVPAARRVISALAPRMLQIAAKRSAGTHPYLTVPAHTAWAREVLGLDAIVAPEVMVVADTDPATARESGRAILSGYLGLENYTRTMTAWGFENSDIALPGSDRLVDTLTPWGAPEHLAAALRAHVDAGASHVCAQIVPVAGDPVPALRALAEALELRGV
jgi:probable F420-dependent oxidoreductase